MSESTEWFKRAMAVMPGGVNSPVRAFKAVGGDPPVVVSGSGPRVTTTDGVELIDFISSWGALLFGHADPEIVSAIEDAARRGTSFGVTSPGEVELAELIVELIPSIEVVRLVNSGTEATASAIRLARAATGRSALVKFEGCYHGHADPFLVKAGSGAATFGEPDSPGVPAGTVADVRPVRYNDLAKVERVLADGQVAAVIVEPVAGNMGVVPPAPEFLPGLRELCHLHGTLLIFDEVMTGFRVGPGGAQARYGVTPDLTCLGKIMAGGTPGAAYGGPAELMKRVSPEGPVYQAGTMSGNPVVVGAGLACLRKIRADPEVYERIEILGERMESELMAALSAAGGSGCVQRVGGMLTVFFGPERVGSWDEADTADRDRFARFFRAAYRRGVLLPPSQFEAWFLTDSHPAVGDEALAILTDAIIETA
ncbi:MAG TPA: glutamate-1-semialdehyde 2,1-aminomutase [Acidimicrobiia bacterium]|nr:glutamate-1-semialdehyde 2,1-aminomutase [Acidimicrobiia bacterium]